MKVKLTLRPRRRAADGHRRHGGLHRHGRGRRSPHRRVRPRAHRVVRARRGGDARGRAARRLGRSNRSSPRSTSARRPSGPASRAGVVTHGKRPAADAAGLRHAPQRRHPASRPTGRCRARSSRSASAHATIGRGADQRHRARRPDGLQAPRAHRGRQPHRARRPELRQRRGRRRRPRSSACGWSSNRPVVIGGTDAGAAPRRDSTPTGAARCSSAAAACTSTAVPRVEVRYPGTALPAAADADGAGRADLPVADPGRADHHGAGASSRSPGASARCC